MEEARKEHWTGSQDIQLSVPTLLLPASCITPLGLGSGPSHGLRGAGKVDQDALRAPQTLARDGKCITEKLFPLLPPLSALLLPHILSGGLGAAGPGKASAFCKAKQGALGEAGPALVTDGKPNQHACPRWEPELHLLRDRQMRIPGQVVSDGGGEGWALQLEAREGPWRCGCQPRS